MNLKDYILDDVITTKLVKEHVERKKPETIFKLIYENDTDFILNKSTARTDRDLVCIVSKGQYYIKNNKTNEIENLTSVEQIKTFKHGMNVIPTFEKLTWKPFEYTYYNTIQIPSTVKDVLAHKDIVMILANKKLNPMSHVHLIREYQANPEIFNSTNLITSTMKVIYPDFHLNDYYISKYTQFITKCGLDANKMRNLKRIIDEINLKYGENSFKELIEYKAETIATIVNDYNCELKTFLEWILYTIAYRNHLEPQISGCNYYGHKYFNFNDYIDYLSQQQQMYGKIKEKYPTYWLSEEYMMTEKYNEWRKIKDVEIFTIEQEKIKQYEYENSVYKVIVPLLNTDILDEAEQQHHCVASYIDLIKAGKTHIVFIRQRLNEDISCLTVEISPKGEIIQVRGLRNRAYTQMEYDFMVEWSKAVGLELKVEPPEKPEED